MELEYLGYKIRIEQDEDPQNPLEWETLGTFSCFHPRYNLSSPDNPYKNDDKGLYKHLSSGEALYLPLYLYDHSGITISTKPFYDPWDSGQVGYVWVDKKKIRKEWKVKIVSSKLKKQILRNLELCVMEFDDYLRGNVYGFIVEDKDDEHVDSCWGFFGWPDENSEVVKEAKAVVDSIIANQKTK